MPTDLLELQAIGWPDWQLARVALERLDATATAPQATDRYDPTWEADGLTIFRRAVEAEYRFGWSAERPPVPLDRRGGPLTEEQVAALEEHAERSRLRPFWIVSPAEYRLGVCVLAHPLDVGGDRWAETAWELDWDLNREGGVVALVLRKGRVDAQALEGVTA